MLSANARIRRFQSGVCRSHPKTWLWLLSVLHKQVERDPSEGFRPRSHLKTRLWSFLGLETLGEVAHQRVLRIIPEKVERRRLELPTSALRTQESPIVSRPNKEVTDTPPTVCTTVCTGESESGRASQLESLLVAIRELSEQDRATLASILADRRAAGCVEPSSQLENQPLRRSAVNK